LDSVSKDQKLDATFWMILWFFIVLFGPYFPVFARVPLRLDHFLVPIIGTGILSFHILKRRPLQIPWFFYPLVGFIAVAGIATLLSLNEGVFFIKVLPFLAALENHLRIGLIILCGGILCQKYSFSNETLFRALFFAGVVLSVFGILQVETRLEWIHACVRKLSVDWYAGRHDRATSIVELCMGKRAVSTFYSPGNDALFCLFLAPFILLTKNRFGISKWVFRVGVVLFFFGVVVNYFQRIYGRGACSWVLSSCPKKLAGIFSRDLCLNSCRDSYGIHFPLCDQLLSELCL